MYRNLRGFSDPEAIQVLEFSVQALGARGSEFRV